MKAIEVRRDGTSARALEGRVICGDVRGADGKVTVEKGQVLDAELARRLLDLPWRVLHLLELEPGDIHEEPAGARLSQAAAGEGVEVKGYGGGQWTLAAARRGLLRVREQALAEVNAQEGMAVYTLYDLQPVESGEAVARAKIVPLAIAEALVKRAEARAWAASGLVTVKAFRPLRIGAMTRANLPAPQKARFEAALAAKGADVIVAAGAASLDPLDAIFEGLRMAGGDMVRHGTPAHPGSLLWLARWKDRPVLGMPACGMFSQATSFDLVLPRLLAGGEVGNAELAGMGHGGLLSRESAWRFPPYRQSAARGKLPE